MSIIHEALKKVQFSMKRTPVAPVEEIRASGIPETPATAAPVAKKKNAPFLMIFGIMTILGAGGYLGYLQFIKFEPQLKSMTRTMIPSMPKEIQPLAKIITAPAASAQATTASPAKIYSKTEFILEGIMTANGSTVALINGKIYTSGESIEDLKITKISKNSISILRGGKEEEIRVRR